VDNWRIVGIEGLTQGTTLQGTYRWLEYRLTFADFRESFVYPRGGSLYLGLVNPKSISDANCVPNSVLLNYVLGGWADRDGTGAGGRGSALPRPEMVRQPRPGRAEEDA